MSEPSTLVPLTATQIDLLLTGLEKWRGEYDTGEDWSAVEALERLLEAALDAGQRLEPGTGAPK